MCFRRGAAIYCVLREYENFPLDRHLKRRGLLKTQRIPKYDNEYGSLVEIVAERIRMEKWKSHTMESCPAEHRYSFLSCRGRMWGISRACCLYSERRGRVSRARTETAMGAGSSAMSSIEPAKVNTRHICNESI